MRLRLFSQQNEESRAVFFLKDLFVYVFCTIWSFLFFQKVHFGCFLDVSNREVESIHCGSLSSISKCYLNPLHKIAMIFTIKRTVESSFFLDRFVCICVLYHLAILVFFQKVHFGCFLDVANREVESPLQESEQYSISNRYLIPLHEIAIIFTAK